jgi:CheY-like chemotaxis protein/tRNA A-37 threonylcarbamoyl transferase component Bud32
MSEPTPTRFGDYVLIERIGDGGMAEIFLAKRHGYSGFEKLIALKRILPRYSGNETFVRMLIQEAKLAADLQHFNIVQVLDLGDVDGQVYLAMEYVKGRDLASILSAAYRRKESIPVPIGVCIATEFLTGLDYAHRKTDERNRPLGIIHRDISPQNILISYEGEVKVTDFGIARFISEKADFQLPGNLHGKFGYMSPEQVGGYEIDQRSDIFSAGVVLWEMLTGRRLFRGKSPKETIDLVVQKPVPAPSEVNPEVPPEIDRICLSALERDRDSRFQTVGAFLGELTRASDALARRAAPRDVSVYMRRQFGREKDRPRTTPRPRVRSTITADRDRPMLGEVLREMAVVTTDDLNIGLAEQRARGDRIGRVLTGLGLATETDVAKALAQQYGYAFVPAESAVETPMPAGLAGRYPRDAAERTCLLPWDHDAEGRVRVLGHDPTSESALLEARVILGARQLELSVTTFSAVQSLIDRWYAAEPTEAAAPAVLVADGDPDGVGDLVDRLREEDLEVLVAHDGRQARGIIDAQPIAVAILDASLPRIDGFNLLLHLRSRQSHAGAFITSARADAFRQSKALELGAEDFFEKPLMLEPVASKVRRIVRRVQRETSADWGPESGVAGDLSHMSLVDIVQSLEVAAKSAEIEIQYEDGRSGRVFVDRGQLHRCEPLHGDAPETFYRLARPGRGRFRVRYCSVEGQPKNLERPTTFLLMEAMRRLDELEHEAQRAAPVLSVDDLVLDAPREEESTVIVSPPAGES